MNVRLKPEHEAMVRRKVEAGLFADADDVVAKALDRMEADDKLERLKAAIDVGYQQYLRGETRPLTLELVDEMNRQADEDERLGLPIRDEVQPQR